MKVSHLKLLLAVLASESVVSFIPTRLLLERSQHRKRSCCEKLGASSFDGILTDDAVRLAYESWRSKYRKEGFDESRFENFATNYRILMNSNIQARNQAFAEGRAPPQWLDLNEFGDFSREEYEIMKQGSRQSNNEDYRPNTASPNSLPRGDTDTASPQQYRGTIPIEKSGINLDTPRKTLALDIPQGSSWSDVRGTKVIEQPQKPQSVRGTQVVTSYNYQQAQAEPPLAAAPEQPVEYPAGGTQPIRGTQVVTSYNYQQAQAEPPVAAAPEPPVEYPAGGTQPIRGTQVVTSYNYQQAQAEPPVAAAPEQPVEYPAGGTQPIRGTQVVTSYSYQATQGPLTSNENNEPSISPDQYSAGRGTRVVTRPPDDIANGTPSVSLFGGSNVSKSRSRSVRGTLVVQSGDGLSGSTPIDGNRPTIMIDPSDARQSAPGSFSSQENTENNSRGTLVIEKNPFSSALAMLTGLTQRESGSDQNNRK